MNEYIYVLIFSLIGGLFSLIGGLILLRKKSTADKLSFYATPFAAGALLAAVFLDLLKEGIHVSSPDTVLLAALVGILGFFLAERFLHWFHHHHGTDDEAKNASKSLIIAGDTLHNALDGVAIASAFLISIPTGIVTTLAVAAHEIPQEIGDFGLLLKKGMSRKNVLIVNIISSLATVLAALGTYALGSADVLPIGVLFGVSAGFLLYIAMSDIIPTIHEEADKKKILSVQPIMLLVGVLVVGLAINLAHGYVETEDRHGSESSLHAGEAHAEEDEHHDEDEDAHLGPDHRLQRIAEEIDDEQQQRQLRQRQEQVGKPHQGGVDAAARDAGDRADHDTDDDRHQHRGKAVLATLRVVAGDRPPAVALGFRRGPQRIRDLLAQQRLRHCQPGGRDLFADGCQQRRLIAELVGLEADREQSADLRFQVGSASLQQLQVLLCPADSLFVLPRRVAPPARQGPGPRISDSGNAAACDAAAP